MDEEKENIEIKEIKDKKEKQKEAVAKQHNFSTQKVGLWFEIDITVFTVRNFRFFQTFWIDYACIFGLLSASKPYATGLVFAFFSFD